MNKIRIENIYILLSMFCIVSVGLIALKSMDIKTDPTIYDDRCEMYDIHGNFVRYENSNVNGLYFHEHKFYTVWIEDTTPKKITLTDYHEACHNFIDETYEHFCGE